ncbi:STAS domain-containing protein [Geomonas sp. Red32]|uniref:STAS domain-containing protein n=1 Tax=Geomonas sp. Red32 TaxID=2912856 RepID=UPI00202CCD7F|nr:STAS domain-containing protein [Geomonas sp. Red32]MCM0080048.1 STAS domain-containing protein [Geomonas sp. Red32]
MQISLQQQQDHQVISLSGRLDASTAPLLQDRFQQALTPESCRFIVEMSEVDYVSSGGLRVLLVMTKMVRALGGEIVLARLHPFVEDLMTMSGFNTMIPATATREEAQRLLTAGGMP